MANVDGSFIYTADLLSRLGDHPNRRSEEAIKRGLDELIQKKVILARATREGFSQDPLIQDAIEDVIVAAYRERYLATNTAFATEQQISNYYSVNTIEFTRPEAIRIGVVKLDANARNRETLVDQFRSADEVEFKQLATKYSADQATRYRGGDIGWIEKTDRYPRWPTEVMNTAWQLDEIGMVSDPIQADGSVYLVRLNAVQRGRTNSFDSVAGVIRHRLNKQLQNQAREDFYEELQEDIEVEIYDDVLEELSRPQTRQVVTPPTTPAN